MALTPSVLSTVNSGAVARTVTNTPNRNSLLNSATSSVGSQNQNRNNGNSASKVTELSDNIQTIKDSSLLYQLISRLLLTPEQDQQLSDSLSLSKETQELEVNAESLTIALQSSTTTNLENVSNSFQVELRLEVLIIDINQQSITITDQSGTRSESRTVIQATSISIELTIGGKFQPVEESDPLIIDVDGDGITTSGIEAGAIFDINADGKLDQVSVATNDNAFLALDINGNGIIDNGAELFGDQNGYDNGFSYLSSFDDNNDRVIDANDKIFNSLLMMRLIDNEQFISELASTDITSINLDYTNTDAKTSAGDRIVQLSEYKNSEGQQGRVADLLLQYKSGIHS